MPQTIQTNERSAVVDASADAGSFTIRFDATNDDAPFSFVVGGRDGAEVVFPVSVDVWHKLFAWLSEREQSRGRN